MTPCIRHSFFKSLTLTLVVWLVALPAWGWGQTGHRITGAIAQQYLSPTAASKVAQILPLESLAEASTYADEMKSNPKEFWQKTANPWHYVTVPEGKHYHDVGAPTEGDAVTALADFSATLVNPNASQKEKQLALRFIVHIIGDLHQPLHAGNGTDRGGNDLKVRFFWQDSNLHRVWDSGMIDRRQLSFSEWSQWLSAKITEQDVQQWQTTNPEQWITESTKIRDTLYPVDANKMSWDYLYDHLPVAKKRLQQAGVRIAYYLNQIFDKTSAKD